MYLSTRQFEIIKALRKSITPIPSELLCYMLDVSPRTLRYEISGINGLTKSRLVHSGSRGYYLDMHEDLDELFGSIEMEDFKNGINWILIKILDKGRISIADLEDRFLRSSSVIRGLLPEIEQQMNRFDLKLEQKSGVLTVRGKESDKRRLIMHSFFFNSGDDHVFQEDTDRFFHVIVPEVIHDIIDEVTEEKGMPLTDIYRRNVVLLFAVALERIHQGNPIEQSEAQTAQYLEGERKFVDAVIEKMNALTDLTFDEAERSYLARSVFGLVRPEDGDETALNLKRGGFRSAVEKLLAETFAHFDISYDFHSFLDGFTLHVFYLIVRYRTNSFFKNDITSTMRHSNPFVYEVSVYLASLIEEQFQIQIPNDEIGLLAVYIGTALERGGSEHCARAVLVCPEYNDVRQLLLRKLNHFFGSQLEIVAVVPSYIDIAAGLQYDFLISTISRQKTVKSVVNISALLGQRDFERIQEKIGELTRARKLAEIDYYLRKYLQKQHFFTNGTLKTGKEVLEFLTGRLLAEDMIPPNYLADVLKREKLASTAFFSRVAVPHALKVSAKQTQLVYYYSEQPIDWFGNRVNLVLLLANKGHDREFVKVYELLFEIIMNSELLYRIQRCKTYEELIEFILSIA